jgi:hypothetical protein
MNPGSGGTGHYINDAYHMDADADVGAGGTPQDASSVYPSAPASISVKVDAVLIAGSRQHARYGITCRWTETSWYAFVVEGESVSIWRHDSSSDHRLAFGTAQVDVDDTTELVATCEEGNDSGQTDLDVQLVVNGEIVAEGTDSTPLSAGSVGLFVDSRDTIATEVQFDNFIVTRV